MGRILLQHFIPNIALEYPFQLVYGRAPPTMASYQLGVAHVAALDKQLRDRDAFLVEICERLLLVSDHMKL